MIFDTHAHYDVEDFDEDRDAVLSSMKENGVGNIVNVGSDWRGCLVSAELAKKYPFIYAAVGIHPDDCGWLSEENFVKLRELAKSGERVVAIGEIGLDYYHDTKPRDVQKMWFVRQLELAGELDLPVYIHSREACADTLEIMREHAKGLSGIIHCFSYSMETANEYVKMGFYIGIGGVVTFKKSKKLKEIAANIPLESIVLETDCPYLAPEPYRGRRNDSSKIKYVAEEIARLRTITYDEVVAKTEENARKLLGV